MEFDADYRVWGMLCPEHGLQRVCIDRRINSTTQGEPMCVVCYHEWAERVEFVRMVAKI